MKYLSMASLCFLLLSCDNSEDISFLSGYNSLAHISCFCDDFDIVLGQQQWKLDFEKNELDVKIFGDSETALILNEGLYNIQFAGDTLMVAGKRFRFEDKENGFFLRNFTPPQLFDVDVLYRFLENE